MKRNPTKTDFRPASLRQPGSARTVLLRMAADQERADRIRALKLERPDLTWRRIADYVGVSERAASDWQKKGGIEYDNAKKLAALFKVDVDYIWRGGETETPSPFAGQDSVASELEAISERLDAIEELLAQLTAAIRGQTVENVRQRMAGDAERRTGRERRVKAEGREVAG